VGVNVFSAMTLLVGHQKNHPVYNKSIRPLKWQLANSDKLKMAIETVSICVQYVCKECADR